MTDTPRSQAVLITAAADNTTGNYTNQNQRDFIVTVVPTGTTLTSGSSVTMTTTVLLVNKTSGSPTTVTLPASPIVFTQTYIVKDQKGDAATNNITLVPSSGLIEGASSFVMNVNRMSVSLIFDGTNWNVVVGTAIAPTGTGQFVVSNGKLLTPTGSVFYGMGTNVADWAAVGGGGPGNIGNGTKTVNGSGTPITGDDGLYIFTLFPQTNFVRLNCQKGLALDTNAGSYNDAPSNFTTFVNNLTSKKCVVVIEDHVGSSPTIPSGATLTNQNQWYADMATTFINNPYVWFGTMNEPWGGSGTTPATMTANQLQTYNAIRGTGNTNPILLEISNPPSSEGWTSAVASNFSGMHNVVWDLHCYTLTVNAGNPSSSQSAANTAMANAIGFVQNCGISSADGVIPIICGEYGPSVTGSSIDIDGATTVLAVQNSPSLFGTIAWTWYSGSDDDIQVTGNVTTWGTELQEYLAGSPPSSWAG